MAAPTLLFEIFLAATGRNIQELRIRAGVTVRDLQLALGFNTPNAIYKWINGLCLPTLDNLVILAAILGVKIDDILVLNAQQGRLSA